MNPQRGTALITAVLIAAVATLIATQLLARQARDLSRLQTVADQREMHAWLAGGFDWARAALLADRASTATDHLGEAWNQPLMALPAEGAVIAGRLTDAQGRFNLNNLIATNGDVDYLRYRRLLAHLGLPAELADSLRDFIDANSEGAYEDSTYLGGDASQPAQPYRVPNQALASESELARVKGYTDAVRTRLAPYVVALPMRADRRPTALNVNTVDAIVLAAYADITREAAEKAILARKARPLAHPDELRALLNRPDTPTNTDVRSDFFMAQFSVTRGNTSRSGQALLSRVGGTDAFIIRFEPL